MQNTVRQVSTQISIREEILIKRNKMLLEYLWLEWRSRPDWCTWKRTNAEAGLSSPDSSKSYSFKSDGHSKISSKSRDLLRVKAITCDFIKTMSFSHPVSLRALLLGTGLCGRRPHPSGEKYWSVRNIVSVQKFVPHPSHKSMQVLTLVMK